MRAKTIGLIAHPQKKGVAELVQAVAKEFGRQACGTCHTPFRVPPPQQQAPAAPQPQPR